MTHLPRPTPASDTNNIRETSYTNTADDNELSVTWTDPDFDPSQHAVYYVRVIEIPTPRWSTYDAKAKGIEPLDWYLQHCRNEDGHHRSGIHLIHHS